MANFTTSGPNFSIFVTGFENLDTLTGPGTLITVEEYLISGGIVNVNFETDLVAIAIVQYLDTSESYPTSGPTVSLELGIVISIGGGSTNLPTSGQVWPIVL